MRRPRFSRAVSVRLAELVFGLADGDVVEQRLACDRCGVPVARVKPLVGRRSTKNVDGSLHAKTCTNRYARLYTTLHRGLDAPTAEEIYSRKMSARNRVIRRHGE
jgi:hypothetical protein